MAVAVHRTFPSPQVLLPGVWLVAPIATVAAYFFQAELAPQVTGALWGTYYLTPAVWALAAVAAGTAALKTLAPARVERREAGASIPFVAALVGLFQLSLLVTAGILSGLGRSPYAHQFIWLFRNALFFGVPLVAIELARWAVLRRFAVSHLTSALFLTALASAAASLSLAQYRGVALDQATLFLVGRDVLPALASGVLAGMFCYLDGPRSALIYRGVLQAFWVLSPVLPDLQWIVLGFVGVAAPALGLWVIEGLVADPASSEGAEGFGLSPAWLVTSVIALAIFFFSFGFFGVKPSFIPSQSMEPKLNPGDIVLTRSVDPADVKIGDIVRYKKGNVEVIHRVIGINPDGTFSTKGDNNNVADPEPVRRDQVVGRYVGRVPYLGWVPVKFQQFLSKFVP